MKAFPTLCGWILLSALAGSVSAGAKDLPPTIQITPEIPQDEGWHICNRTSIDSINVAYAFKDRSTWVRKGWRKINRGECSRMISHITNRHVYYYARGGAKTWTGNKRFCVDPKNAFEISGDCPAGTELRDFVEVDTRGSATFTSNLTESR
jgi:uncharacterized membrane protein